MSRTTVALLHPSAIDATRLSVEFDGPQKISVVVDGLELQVTLSLLECIDVASSVEMSAAFAESVSYSIDVHSSLRNLLLWISESMQESILLSAGCSPAMVYMESILESAGVDIDADLNMGLCFHSNPIEVLVGSNIGMPMVSLYVTCVAAIEPNISANHNVIHSFAHASNVIESDVSIISQNHVFESVRSELSVGVSVRERQVALRPLREIASVYLGEFTTRTMEEWFYKDIL